LRRKAPAQFVPCREGTSAARTRYKNVFAREVSLADPHQVNSIIATALCDCRKDDPNNRIDPGEAKQIAKCIVEALSNAGLKIVPAAEN
jgi:hypothetical protein